MTEELVVGIDKGIKALGTGIDKKTIDVVHGNKLISTYKNIYNEIIRLQQPPLELRKILLIFGVIIILFLFGVGIIMLVIWVIVAIYKKIIKGKTFGESFKWPLIFLT